MPKHTIESSASLAGFEHYYNQGEHRTLERTARELNFSLQTVKTWSAGLAWRDRCVERRRDEMEAARTAARKEAGMLARRRLRNAQVLQDSGLILISNADLTKTTPAQALKLLGDARAMLVEGMKAERLELGEATESIVPPKPLSQMDAEELADYIAKLEKAQ